MLPQGVLSPQIQYEQQSEQPSRTYKLDLNQGRIVGNVDSLEAIQQAVYKILATERFYYLIYSPNYGSELQVNAMNSELERWITEALLWDERIQAIENLRVQRTGESALVEFTVVSTAGRFSVLQEVN
ncbi:DUF2634 domain-containing protein [Paenibacillus sp. GCM10012307]|uniref:DUF2634 domain-containing protein n=1 Tax=Paenibacillus roseus TaxID=2798579 RepID=A0A934MTU7_9BACL|nr:DUF2634 domain-containing protein [Paenibacillus roseus]MBJ6360432.1 DUF2634 domain-containing protein [Paenibacillus roseus]